MRHLLVFLMSLASTVAGWSAERVFDYGQYPTNQTPPGFRSTVSGEGKPGDWRIILEDAPPLLGGVADGSKTHTKRPVLAQLARDKTDEHFPLLVFENEVFTDFTLTTQFKTVDGAAEQMAGIAFRIEDERNYYVVRASSLGNTLRFYKFVDGVRSPPIGQPVQVPRGQWHTLTVECKANTIRLLLNGKEAMPPLNDSSFPAGKIGFWTKSDSVTYFADTRISYVPREHGARVLVREAMAQYPRLVGIKVFMTSPDSHDLRLVASSDPQEQTLKGEAVERDVLENGSSYVARGRTTVAVTLPLRDRNGDPIAVVRVTMNRFPGQTEQNALVRAKPVVDHMQHRVRSAKDLLD